MSEEISSKKGETMTVQLESNPTTGFAWTAEFDSNFLSLVNKEFTHSANSVGAGGTERFEFRALKSGTTVLRMIYKREFENANIKEKTYKVHIV